MISKRIAGRKDGKSSAMAALKYGEGLKPDLETGELLDKSHRTRLGNFGIIDDGVFVGQDMAELIELAAIEMQANCDLNSSVGADKKLAHFVVSFNQDKPSEAVLRDTEDSMLAKMDLDKNHFATFLHNDNGYWHLHIFASRIEKEKPHRGNSLWHDKINRDKVCREIETRHNLLRDNGLHKVDELGQIVEIPRDERIANREAKPSLITDQARKKEIYSGEKSFQTWATEIRIGDRLKHSKNWQDLHVAAAAYGCEIKEKGAGFVVCPIGEKGGIQLSKVGLKNLPAKFGAFEAATRGKLQASPVANYTPSPADKKSESQYSRWMKAKETFKPLKIERLNELREANKEARKKLRELHKAELVKIRSAKKGHEKLAAVSVAKMKQSIEMAVLSEQISAERRDTYQQLKEIGPGSTFRDYLVKEAANGDDSALAHAQKYGQEESTEVSRKRESDKLGMVATLSGHESKYTTRLPFTHRIERTGTVVFNLGQGRVITDSAISKQVQLNKIAESNPEAIATALRFATSKFGSTLTLNGSQEFQRLAVETSVLKGLGIKFADPALEAYREKFVADQKFKLTQEKQNASNNRKQQIGRTPPPHRRDRLHDLSDSDLVLDTSGDVMLLREDVPDRVEQFKERPDHGMQRPASGLAGGGTGISQSEVMSVPAVHVDVAKLLEDWQAVPVSEAYGRMGTRGFVKAVEGRYFIQDIGQRTHVLHQLAEGCKAPAVGSRVFIKNGVVTELARERPDREFGRK
jgi:hypothetical protein